MIELIISQNWGRAGDVAFALDWRPQGRHFRTPQGYEGRMLSESDDFAFIPTKGSTLHLVLPLPPNTLRTAQYVSDMGRARLVVYE